MSSIAWGRSSSEQVWTSMRRSPRPRDLEGSFELLSASEEAAMNADLLEDDVNQRQLELFRG